MSKSPNNYKNYRNEYRYSNYKDYRNEYECSNYRDMDSQRLGEYHEELLRLEYKIKELNDQKNKLQFCDSKNRAMITNLIEEIKTLTKENKKLEEELNKVHSRFELLDL